MTSVYLNMGFLQSTAPVPSSFLPSNIWLLLFHPWFLILGFCAVYSLTRNLVFFQGRFNLLSSLHMDAVFFTLSLFACLLPCGHFHLCSLYSNWPLIISKARYSCSDINQFWLNERISSLLLYTEKKVWCNKRVIQNPGRQASNSDKLGSLTLSWKKQPCICQTQWTRFFTK